MLNRCFLYCYRTLLFIAFLELSSCEQNTQEDCCPYFILPEFSMHQSMAIHFNDALFVTFENNQLICDIYDLSTKTHKKTLTLPFGDHSAPHANVSCLGNYLFSSNSDYPCLYVSQWDGQRMAFVYNINTKDSITEASLVQVIDPSQLTEDIIGFGCLDWVVDEEGAYIYSVSYQKSNSAFDFYDNSTIITKFKLPDPYSSDYVYLTDEDILDSFHIPIINVSQDKCFYKGLLYIASGYSDSKHFFPNVLYRVDVNKKESIGCLININGEPEGLSVYNGRLLINMCDHSGRMFYLN